MISAVLVPPARNQIQIWIIRRSTEGGNRWMSEMWQREIVECQRCGKNLQSHSIVGFDYLTASVQAMALTTEKIFFQTYVVTLLCIFWLVNLITACPLIWTTSDRKICREDRGEQFTFWFFNHCLKTNQGFTSSCSSIFFGLNHRVDRVLGFSICANWDSPTAHSQASGQYSFLLWFRGGRGIHTRLRGGGSQFRRGTDTVVL